MSSATRLGPATTASRRIVTPWGANGKPDPATRYELRGTQPIPEDAMPTAVYDPATKTLTVTGRSSRRARPRVGINVHIFGGATSDYEKQKELGYATTKAGGAYRFTRRLGDAAEVGLRLRLPLPLPDLLGRLVGPGRLRAAPRPTASPPTRCAVKVGRRPQPEPRYFTRRAGRAPS